MLLTIRQAEVFTGYSSDSLRNWIKDGKLTATIVGNKYMISQEDLAPYVKVKKDSLMNDIVLKKEDANKENFFPYSETSALERERLLTQRVIELKEMISMVIQTSTV